jgi:hypothetical protein
MFSENSNPVKPSVALAIIMALAILSFRQYFFYVPFANGFNAISFLGFCALIGWLALLLMPPTLLSMTKTWSTAKSVLLMISVLVYPVSTTFVKIYTLSTYGKIWAQYLALYPILAFIEFVVPAFYIIVAVSLNRRLKAARSLAV